jgi:hypothetical protein
LQRLLGRVRTLLRLETVLVAFILAAVAAAAFLYQQREDARDELKSLQTDQTIAQEDVNALRAEKASKSEELARKQEELAAKQEESDALEMTPGSVVLTSRQEAIDLSAQLVNFATAGSVSLRNLVSGQQNVSIAGVDFPAVTYALVATGDPFALVEILYVIESVPTARIGGLEFARDPKDEEAKQWIMTLDMVVVYREEG